jgi:hypothetical protein
VDGEGVRAAVVYGLLNAREPIRRELGVDAVLEHQIRVRLEAGGMDDAAALVTDTAMKAFLAPDDARAAAAVARGLGASIIAIQGFDLKTLADRVEWAREVVDSLREGEPM